MNEGRTWTFIFSLLILGGIIYATSNRGDDPPSPSPSHSAADDDSDSPASAGLTFHGYDCTVDCSGHEAGYQWAEEHDITDEDDCDGNSESLIEGCKAYVQEQGYAKRDGDRDDEDPNDE